MDTLRQLPLSLIRNLVANIDLAILLGAYYGVAQLMKRRAAGLGINAARMGDLTMWVAVGAVVGGRIAHIVSVGGLSDIGLRATLLINTGMNLYGAIAGGLLVGWLYAKRRRLPIGMSLDIFALFVPLVIVAQRFSCLVTTSCYGRQASAPFGIRFAGNAQPRIPSDLYEGLLTLLLFAGLLWLSTKLYQPRGVLFLAFLVGYPLMRAAIDMTRISIGGMERSADPILSIAIAVAAGVSLLVVLGRRRIGDVRGAVQSQMEPMTTDATHHSPPPSPGGSVESGRIL